jgi:hypothetical protein
MGIFTSLSNLAKRINANLAIRKAWIFQNIKIQSYRDTFEPLGMVVHSHLSCGN